MKRRINICLAGPYMAWVNAQAGSRSQVIDGLVQRAIAGKLPAPPPDLPCQRRAYVRVNVSVSQETYEWLQAQKNAQNPKWGKMRAVLEWLILQATKEGDVEEESQN